MANVEGVNLSPDDIVRIINASGEAKGRGTTEGPQPLWCGIGCGGHLAAVESKSKRPQEA
jgi:hypothetical protein